MLVIAVLWAVLCRWGQSMGMGIWIPFPGSRDRDPGPYCNGKANTRPTFSLWERCSNTLLQDCPSWLMVTENSVTIICVSTDRAPWVMTPVTRLIFPKSTCSHSWGLLFWGERFRSEETRLHTVEEDFQTERAKVRADQNCGFCFYLPFSIV